MLDLCYVVVNLGFNIKHETTKERQVYSMWKSTQCKANKQEATVFK